jgi:hypothetical protein
MFCEVSPPRKSLYGTCAPLVVMLLQFETCLAIVTDCEMLDGISADHDGRG